jgi:hypothetical protein
MVSQTVGQDFLGGLHPTQRGFTELSRMVSNIAVSTHNFGKPVRFNIGALENVQVAAATDTLHEFFHDRIITFLRHGFSNCGSGLLGWVASYLKGIH